MMMVNHLAKALWRFVTEEERPLGEDGVEWAKGRVREIVQRGRQSIPDEAVCFFRDGNKWCCVFGDFADLHQSPAGFVTTSTRRLRP